MNSEYDFRRRFKKSSLNGQGVMACNDFSYVRNHAFRQPKDIPDLAAVVLSRSRNGELA